MALFWRNEVDIFDPAHSAIHSRKTLRLWTEPPSGYAIRTLQLDVIKLSSKPLAEFIGILEFIKYQGDLYLVDNSKDGRYRRQVAVAKLERSTFFEMAFENTLQFLSFYLVKIDSESLQVSVVLPHSMVIPTIENALSFRVTRKVSEHDLTAMMRLFRFIDEDNTFCRMHVHDDVLGRCHPRLEKNFPAEKEEEFQAFFDGVRAKAAPTTRYKLDTEKLSSRLYPYQEEAARFMINREMNPDLNYSLARSLHHNKVETEQGPLYYLPNLAIFLTNEPSIFPQLSTCGGILADEMGLGKTVELLALITSFTSERTPMKEEKREEKENEDVNEEGGDSEEKKLRNNEGLEHFGQYRRNARENIYYTQSKYGPEVSKREVMISCVECGTSCMQYKLHWTNEMSEKHDFVCPECVREMKTPIPVRATLIIVPTTIAHQWYDEIRRHVKETLKIDVYKGLAVEGYKHPHYLNQFDVVITTYDVISSERSHLGTFDRSRLRKRNYEFSKAAPSPLFSVNWWRVCLDESQMVDRESSELSKLCRELQARARWCVTGTPISRAFGDIHGMLHFLGLSPLDQRYFFDLLALNGYREGGEKDPFLSIMGEIMWRTEKKHLQKWSSRVVTHVERVSLSPIEERTYAHVLALSKEKVFSAVEGVDGSTLLSNLAPAVYRRLFGALADIQLFLLTSMTPSGQADAKAGAEPFTPEALFLRQLKERKGEVMKQIRYTVKAIFDVADSHWMGNRLDKALEFYLNASQLVEMTGVLNEQLGHPKEIVVKSYLRPDRDEELREGSIGHPVSFDFHLFTKLYRCVGWLLEECPQLKEKNTLDMEKYRSIFQEAWLSYFDKYEVDCELRAEEWKRRRGEAKKSAENLRGFKSWIENQCSKVQKLDLEVRERLWLKLEEQLGVNIGTVSELKNWMKRKMESAEELAKDFIPLVDSAFSVCEVDDLEEEMSWHSAKTMRQPEATTFRKGEAVPFVRRQVWNGMSGRSIYEGCVRCPLAEYNSESRNTCLLCAIQATYSEMQAKEMTAKCSVFLLIQRVTRMITNAIGEQCDSLLDEEGRLAFISTLHTLNGMDKCWKLSERAVRTRIFRIRELRLLSLPNDLPSLNELIMEREKTRLDHHIRNLRYIYSLKEDIFAGPSSSRECPICLEDIQIGWNVYPCGHINCVSCFKQVKTMGIAGEVDCSVCRSRFRSNAVSYVQEKRTELKNWIGEKIELSVKLDKIVRLVMELLTKKQDEKCLVFTTRTAGIDALSAVFTDAQIPFLVLGKYNSAATLAEFRNDESKRVLLMLYESGGKGLNLTVANNIIFADTVEDAALEKQAIGRCDRIGQKKEVNVHYIVTKDTVEERVYNLTRQANSAFFNHDAHWSVETLVNLFNDVAI